MAVGFGAVSGGFDAFALNCGLATNAENVVRSVQWRAPRRGTRVGLVSTRRSVVARVKLDFDAARFIFQTELDVRITDVNYGRHVGNDAMLGLLHEARLRFLENFGFSEEDVGGVGMLMGDAVVQFKAVAFRSDRLRVEMGLADVERRTFDLVYRVTREGDGAVVALAKTGMVAFDYARNRPAPLPAAFLEKTGSAGA
jgi:acyl-CoA thioester hydrolase